MRLLQRAQTPAALTLRSPDELRTGQTQIGGSCGQQRHPVHTQQLSTRDDDPSPMALLCKSLLSAP